MSYEPKEWQCGDTITAEDLNHMEQGIAQGGGDSAPLEVHKIFVSDDFYRLDKTWQEIYDAFPNVFYEESHDGVGGKVHIVSVHYDLDGYFVMVDMGNTSTPFLAVEPTDYPETLK